MRYRACRGAKGDIAMDPRALSGAIGGGSLYRREAEIQPVLRAGSGRRGDPAARQAYTDTIKEET